MNSSANAIRDALFPFQTKYNDKTESPNVESTECETWQDPSPVDERAAHSVDRKNKMR
jgi:hypothetical protein